jgi:energy-coupling factor transporter transmembrane protein EcfT
VLEMMGLNIQNIAHLALAGVIILAGVFILRWALKFAWKIVRVALILFSLILVAGYFMGLL